MTSPYTRFASTVLFPAHERLKGHSTIRAWKSLEQSQWWSPERIEQNRVEALRRLLSHAETQVPYYRDLFRSAGFVPGDLRDPAELSALPLLSKSLIKANERELKSLDSRPLRRMNTGGSTGEPLIFYLSADRVSHDVAAKRRATRWWGVDIGDPEIVVWGSPIENTRQDVFRDLRDRVFRTSLLSAFEMSPAKLDGFVDRIRRLRPKMLFGYPSALDVIAGYAEARGVQLNQLGIKVAFVTSEMLYPEQRERISRVFGCPVANGYGGRDAGFVAHECPSGGMHITAEDLILEVLGDDGRPVPTGEVGELVITHLRSFGFPFVRYRTGDMVRLGGSNCPCGRGLPLVTEIHGRSTDLIRLPDGTRMHGLALIYVLRDLPGIERFKIEQEALDQILVRIVPRPGMARDIPHRAQEGLLKRLGPAVSVTVDLVDEIPPERSGKYRYVVSRVT